MDRSSAGEPDEIGVLIERLEALVVSDGSYDEFLALRPHFDACLSLDAARRIFHREWCGRADEVHRSTENVLPLWSGPDRSGLFLQIVQPHGDMPDLLAGSNAHGLLGVFDVPGSPGLEVLISINRSDIDVECFNPDVTVPMPSRHRLTGGASFAFESPVSFYATLPPSDATLCLILRWKMTSQYRWDFSVDDLKPKRIVCLDLDALRAASAATLLGRIDADGNVDTLLKLLGHGDFNVRWQAARALHRLDPELGLAAIHKFEEGDPHEQVRRLASDVASRIIRSA